MAVEVGKLWQDSQGVQVRVASVTDDDRVVVAVCSPGQPGENLTMPEEQFRVIFTEIPGQILD